MTTPTNPATAGAPVTQLPMFTTPQDNDHRRHPEPDLAADTVADRARDAFTAVTSTWSSVADSPPGRAALGAWAARRPALASYDSPAEVVTAINQLGQPARSCALLADLLLLAEHEPLAQLAVLGALLPGLRRVVRQRWTTAVSTGPWRTEGELAADAVSAAWEAIRRLAGRRHPLPARLIIRRVERRLRTIHDAHRRDRARAFPVTDISSTIEPAADLSDNERRFADDLAHAVRSGRITATTEQILEKVRRGRVTLQTITS